MTTIQRYPARRKDIGIPRKVDSGHLQTCLTGCLFLLGSASVQYEILNWPEASSESIIFSLLHCIASGCLMQHQLVLENPLAANRAKDDVTEVGGHHVLLHAFLLCKPLLAHYAAEHTALFLPNLLSLFTKKIYISKH